jgi:2-polyprenyl-3-methyl-5-hydroxy-6-metoxy-1,4-benzoquinol methylase
VSERLQQRPDEQGHASPAARPATSPPFPATTADAGGDRSAERVPTRRALRTTVVWDVLRAALATQTAGAGRTTLDVLDAGGGTGGFAVPLAQLGHHVTVVDPSLDALAALERRVAEAGVDGRITAIQGDTATLDELMPAGSVDVALCHGVLEHVDDPGVALAAVAACLRPGGALSVLAANRYAVVIARAVAGHVSDARHALADPDGRWGPGDPMPRRFSEEDLHRLLAGAGLRVEAVHGVRVVTDLVPGSLVDGEPGGAVALLELEAAAAEHPAFRAVASQLHLLATRH